MGLQRVYRGRIWFTPCLVTKLTGLKKNFASILVPNKASHNYFDTSILYCSLILPKGYGHPSEKHGYQFDAPLMPLCDRTTNLNIRTC